MRKAATLEVLHQNGPVVAEAYSVEFKGLPVYFISGSFIPPEAPVYTSDASVDGLKFTFFSLAALELARALQWAPHLVHANDWHTAPAIYALGLNRKQGSFYSNTATLFGLHNLPYLGVGAGPALASFDLPPAINSPLPEWARHMPLPLGLLSADHIVAASPTYAQEILTKEFGSGLQDFLLTRSASISGILNGLDVQRWDPVEDPVLITNYSADNLPQRWANKIALQKELDLQPDPNLPIFGMVTRLDNQKGVDLVPGALRQIAGQAWQAVILGTGDPALEAAIHRLEVEFPDRVRAVIRFDAELSRRIYAGTDALLIPSRYEPCGLTQMIAMRYGCVPIARATGGLRDTIQDYHLSAESTGFLFSDPTSASLAGALQHALEVYEDFDAWRGLQQRGMAQDFSWERSARQYLELYQVLVKDRNRVGPRA
jgi:starch synthase